MIETAIWWTGAVVLTASALLGSALCVAVISVAAVFLGNYYGRRIFNTQDNLRHMHAWRRAGMPMQPKYTAEARRDGV